MDAKEYQHRYYLAHKDRITAQNKAWAEANKERVKENSRAYYQKHKEEYAEYRRKRNATHVEENREYYRAYLEANREKKYAYMREYRRKNRDYIRNTLAGVACEDCGKQATDWHHVDPANKHRKLAAMFTYSRKRIDEEIAKCVPLCRSCHTKRHCRDGSVGYQK